LVGLTRSYREDENEVHQSKVITVSSPPRVNKPTVEVPPDAKPPFRKGTAQDRVTNFGDDTTSNSNTSSTDPSQLPTPTKTNSNPNNKISTTHNFTGGPFDQHDTAATAALAEDDNTSLASFDSDTMFPSVVMACRDADQIERDVRRCTWHLLTGGQRSRRRVMANKHRKKIGAILLQKQRRLGDLINLTLSMSEVELPDDQRLCYFQGYHDVASIFLAALGGASSKNMPSPAEQSDTNSLGITAAAQAASMGLELPSKILYQVSLSHFREPMNTNFLQLQTAMRMVLFPLLRVMDPELHAHLYACGMEPFFALSWLLTWFSHDIRDTTVVKRLFDFFLVSHPLMPIYLSVAMLCHNSNRQEILSTTCEFAELHNCLAGLPKNSSMVGWKYRVGDGYVSDDEEIGDGDGITSISLDSDMTSHEPGSTGRSTNGPSMLSGNEGMMRREDLILSEDHSHVVSMAIPAHVPFQELIDEAISTMRRIPPRKLLPLAKRYFSPTEAEPILKMYPSISLFHSQPSWALARTIEADWVLKQRAARDRSDRKALSKLRNRKHNNNNNDATKKTSAKPSNEEVCTPEMVQKLARLRKYPKAMIAQGFGPGVDAASSRKKRRKLLFVGGVATVAVIAVVIGVSMRFKKQTRLQQLETQGLPSTEYRGETTTNAKNRAECASCDIPAASPKTGGVQKLQLQSIDILDRHMPKNISAPPNPQKLEKPALATVYISDKNTASTKFVSSVTYRDVNSKDAITTPLQQSKLKLVAIYQLKNLSAKVQLLVRTLGMLRASLSDPELRENVRRGLVELKCRLVQTVVRITDHEVFPDLRMVPHYVAHACGRFLRNTLREVREALGGDDLEDLHLL